MIVMIMKAKVSNSTKSDQHWNGRFLRNTAFLIAYLTQLKNVQNVEKCQPAMCDMTLLQDIVAPATLKSQWSDVTDC